MKPILKLMEWVRLLISKIPSRILLIVPTGMQLTSTVSPILSETYNNITFADEWYNATEDVSLPMIGENWDCFYDENYTYQWDDGKLSIFDGENCLYVLELTGNCINHPNDFSIRIYAQTILSILGC